MEKVKIKNVKTGAIEEVNKSLASDYIGTGRFELYEEKKEQKQQEAIKKNNFKFNINKFDE